MMPLRMALTVIVRSGDLTTPASITFDAPRIVIGRGDGCEVLLPDPSVSHRHASIRQRGSDYVVIDEGSTNGTFVGPVRLSPQAPRMLRSGELLRLGRVWLEVRIEHVPVTMSQKIVTRDIALGLVASALSAQGASAGARVWVRNGPDPKPELLIGAGDREYIVGRGAGVELPLEDPDLSRRQVAIARRGAVLVVRDLGSKNGSFLDGTRLEPRKEVPWPLTAVLTLGQTELVYEDPIALALAELEGSEDERMREDDPVDPPTGVPAPVVTKASAGLRSTDAGAAPIAEVPRAASGGARRSGLRILDVVVGVVALAVLGVSLFGLWLLFRS
ncbi:MAG TPA: FHA domain-containing protein [Polyangiaceae bacterium]|nr:FHA domain-containing protein [Polyangiaceae bacterium]